MNRIASGSGDKTIRLWDAQSMIEVCEPLEGHASIVTGVAFLPDGDSVVSCSRDGTVRVWDLGECGSKGIRNRHAEAVTRVSFMRNGHGVVSGSVDRSLRIWDTKTGNVVGNALCGHTDCVTGVAMTPDSQRIVSVSFDQTVRVWDVNSRELLSIFTGHNRPIQCVAVAPTGEYAVTGARDATVRLWDMARADGSHIMLEGHSAGISRVFASDDGRIISVSWNGEVFVWDAITHDLIQEVIKEGSHELRREEVLKLVGEDSCKG